MVDPALAAGSVSTRRVAVVTGGGRGIGRAISLALARRGVAVAVNYRQDRGAAEETARHIVSEGGMAAAFEASVGDHDALARMVDDAARRLGPISILVNNAGVASRGTPVAASSGDEALDLFRTHALGPLDLCRLVLPAMREQERGDVVMISSSATELYAPNGVVYSMAKAAMEAIAYTLAKEEARHGIRSNAVAPGLVATELGGRLVRAVGGPDVELEDLDRRAPYGRVCTPEDVAGVVAFLVSDEGGYVNGQRLAVDGGAPGYMARPRQHADRPTAASKGDGHGSAVRDRQG